MRSWFAACLLLWAAPAWSGGVLDRVRAEGVVRCGAEQRAGFAAGTDPAGLAVELCRTVAVAVLGPAARVAFQVYGADADFADVRTGAADIAFVSGSAVAAHRLAAAVIPGPAVFFDQVTLMVPQDAAARDLADLSGQGVCFMIASPAQRALEQEAERLHIGFARLAFEEEVEMLDAYDVRRCVAMAGEATELAAYRLTPGVNGLRSRILPRALGLEPLSAATPVADGAWAALVAWVLQGVILADHPATPWTSPGAEAMAGAAAQIGLRPDWLQNLGGYGALYDRTLGMRSRLHLPAGPNAAWPAGLLVPAAD